MEFFSNKISRISYWNRNSFLNIRAKQLQQWKALGLSVEDLFKPVLDIEIAFVKMQSGALLRLEAELKS